MSVEIPEHPAAADLRRRWRPTDRQVAVATAMLAAEPWADVVFVGIALPGKYPGLWTEGQAVRPVPGFWLAARDRMSGVLAYSLAREAADAAAARRLSVRGVSSYATIERDGTWGVFEGTYTDRQEPGQ